MRLDHEQHGLKLVEGLAAELEARLRAAGARGRHITLNLKKRRPVRGGHSDAATQLQGTSTLRPVISVQQARDEEAALGVLAAQRARRRPQGSGEPAKFLGCGICDALSKSVRLARAIDSARELALHAWALLRALCVPWQEIRGLGIQVR